MEEESLQVTALAAEVAALRAEVETVRRALRRLPESVALPLPRWNWDALDDDARARALADLERWVQWAAERYAFADQWPTCWARHSEIVAWTLALRSWHRAVWAPEYEMPPGGGETTVTVVTPRAYWEWHTAGLLPFRAQLHEWARGCGGGRRHQDAVPPEGDRRLGCTSRPTLRGARE